MGKNKSDPVEQLARYMRIIAWTSIAVAGVGSIFLVYIILAGK